MEVFINSGKCINCGNCAGICPVEAIHERDGSYYIDKSICINCLACERECPVEAIEYVYNENKQEINEKSPIENEPSVTEECSIDNKEIDIKDDFIESFLPQDKNQRKQLKKLLKTIVEDKIAPVLEKLFLLFIDGAERIFKK